MNSTSKNLCLICIIALTTLSCTPILNCYMGVRTPELEKPGEIEHYLKKRHVAGFDELRIGKDSAEFIHLLFLVHDIPSVDFFTSEGKMVLYSNTGDCTQKAFDYASSMKKGDSFTIDSSYSLVDVLNKTTLLKWDQVPSAKENGFDYLVVIYWAKYVGKLNKNVFKLIRALKENPDLNIKVVLVNMDFQTNWGLKKAPKITFQE